jgi:hypothetical protein
MIVRCLIVIIAGIAVAVTALAGADPARPQRPFRSVEISPPSHGGRVVRVTPRDNLQAVVDEARRGDVIVLPAGQTFTGPLKLPRV